MAEDPVEFEWDEAKRLSNTAKHGIDCQDAASVWRRATLTRETRFAAEKRYITIGPLWDDIVVVIWTQRGDRRRLIAARIARREEKQDYARFVARSGQSGPRPH